MTDRLVMGYWDCPSCDTKGIQGTLRECPNCGKPRGEDTRFYMKSHSHEEVVANNEYLTDTQAQTKGKGEDWLCGFCGGLNSILVEECPSCGHTREESDPNYFAMRQKAEQKAEKQRENLERAKGTNNKEKKESLADKFYNAMPAWFEWKHLWIGLIVIAVIAGLIFSALPHVHDYHITQKDWERSVEVEQYLYVDESDWYIPDGADYQFSQQEIHHYNKEIDHYEHKTRSYTERVQSGSHTEYSYKDNGDGTFTEHSYTVPDYTYETRYEHYDEPVYRDVPVYQTKYYYKIWRWKYKTTVVNAGDADEEPTDPSPELASNERLGERHETYRLHGYYDEDESNTHDADVEREYWELISVGDTVQVDTDLNGNFRRFM